MMLVRRTLKESENALGDALSRIQELESESNGLSESLAEAERERDEARAEQARLEDRVTELERAVEVARDALAGV